MRGRVIALRARLAGEEQTVVHRRRERRPAVRLARKRIGVGTAGERIDAPTMQMKRPDPAGEVAAEQADQFGPREIKERRLPAVSSSAARVAAK